MLRRLKFYIKRRTIGLFLIAVLALIGLGIYSFLQTQRLIDTAQSIPHANKVISQSEELLTLLLDIETSARGYVITGDSTYLSPYKIGGEKLPTVRSALATLLESSPTQEIRWKKLDSLIDALVNHAEILIATRQKNQQEAYQLVASGDGKMLMDSIRTSITKIHNEARPLFREKDAISGKQLLQFQVSLLGTSALVIMLLITLIYLLNHELKVRKEVEAESKKGQTKFQALLEASPDALVIVDSRGVINLVNTQCIALFGYEKNEIVGRQIETLIPSRYHNSHTNYRKAFFAQAHARPMGSGLELFACRKNGEEFPVEISLSPMIIDGETLVSASIRDVTDRKQAEQNTAFLARLVESTNEAMYSVTPDFHITTWNKGAEEIYGFTRDEVIGQSVYAIIRSALTDEQRSVIRKEIISTGKWQRELEHYRKDGRLVNILASTSAIKNQKGEAIGYVSIARDITEFKKVQTALNQLNLELEERVKQRSQELVYSEAFNRGVINSLAAHIAVINQTGVIVSVNEDWKKFGLENGSQTLERIGVGVNYFEVCERAIASGNGIAKEALDGIKAVINNKFSFFELEYPCHSPEVNRWFSLRVNRFNQDEPMVVLAHVDITRRKEAEEALSERELQLRLFVENSPVSLAMFDTNMRYILTSKRYLIGYNLTNQPIIGKSHYEVFPETAQHWKDIYNRCLKGAVKKNEEEVLTQADGTTDWVRWEIDPWYKRPGEIGGLILMSEVITEKKQVQLEIERLNATLEKKVEERTNQWQRANKELEAFSYSVSHDLRAPLRSIDGYARVLEEDFRDKLGEEGSKVIATITRNASHMGRLIDDMLNLSRLGKLDISLATLNMNDIVDKVIAELVDTKKQKPRITVTKLEPIRADLDMIVQVWTNYIGNAIKYSSKVPSPEIAIGSTIDGQYVEYYVRDNGTGFDNQYVAKLFGVFQRLHRQADFEGTGVGLAIVKRIVEKHEGSVRAVGELNKGATFFFSLPIESKI